MKKIIGYKFIPVVENGIHVFRPAKEGEYYNNGTGDIIHCWVSTNNGYLIYTREEYEIKL